MKVSPFYEGFPTGIRNTQHITIFSRIAVMRIYFICTIGRKKSRIRNPVNSKKQLDASSVPFKEISTASYHERRSNHPTSAVNTIEAIHSMKSHAITNRSLPAVLRES
jgi:hypothetical protein